MVWEGKKQPKQRGGDATDTIIREFADSRGFTKIKCNSPDCQRQARLVIVFDLDESMGAAAYCFEHIEVVLKLLIDMANVLAKGAGE